MILGLVMAGFMAAAPSALETARDQQDRAPLEKMVNDYSTAAAKAPNNADAQYRVALAASYRAEVAIEQHDRKQGRQAAEQGIKAAEKAISLKPEAEYYRVLATLCGQAITDVLSGLSYGPPARDAGDRALPKAPKPSSGYGGRRARSCYLARPYEKAPKSSAVYVSRGVGSYYLPPPLGGGAKQAITDFQKAIELDSKK